jgi:benzoate membrane transport protein
MVTLATSLITIPLSAAHQLGLPRAQLTAWIMAIYTLPGFVGLLLAYRFRQPLLLTGNIFVLIFIVSLQGRLSFAELEGSSMVAGAVVVLVSALGLTDNLARWIPAPVVVGLLAGSSLPFVAGIFTALGSEPVVIGAAFLAYLLSRRYFDPRIPSVLPALVVGIAAAVILGRFKGVDGGFQAPIPEITLPVFTWDAIITASPVMVALVVLQSNTPSLIFLQHQQFEPPARTVDYASGIGTVVASFLGPVGVSLSLPATALVGGPDAGGVRHRYRSAILASSGFLALTAFAGFAADVAAIIPLELLLGLAGLAVIGVLSMALQQMTAGPLTFGPLVAFAVAVSDISLLGLGPYFWSLAFGVLASVLVEPAGLKELRASERGVRAG